MRALSERRMNEILQDPDSKLAEELVKAMAIAYSMESKVKIGERGACDELDPYDSGRSECSHMDHPERAEWQWLRPSFRFHVDAVRVVHEEAPVRVYRHHTP